VISVLSATVREIDLTKFLIAERAAGHTRITLALRSVVHMSAAAVFNSNDARKRRDRWRPCRSVVTTRPGRSDRARPRDPLGWRYLPAGAPPQFVREVQEHDDLMLLLGAEPSGITTATRLPSGARSQLVLQQDITIAMVFSVAVSASCRLEWQRKTSYVFMPFGD
jgi:hypothetical protein